MNNDIQTAIGCMLYIVYIVALNWVYIKEYIGDNKGVIKRGNEWE